MGESLFFAFQSAERTNDHGNVQAIRTAIQNLNGKGYAAKSWEDMQNNGKLINIEVLKEIDASDFFACDLTYLNFNVMFELGYAIGKKKNLFLLLNEGISGARENYKNTDILRMLGYSKFTKSTDIVDAFLKCVPNTKNSLIESLLSLASKNIGLKDIFYIKSKHEGQIELDVYDHLMKIDYSSVCDDSSEVEYRTLSWYINSIYSSKAVILHCLSDKIVNAILYNSVNSLYAGIGLGLGKSVMLLAPYPFDPPIDYADILISYKYSQDACEKMDEWIINNVKRVIPGSNIVSTDHDLNLLKLGLGYDVAENEKDVLANYFVETQAYLRAIDNKRTIVIGRKGSGKTALYIMIDSQLRSKSSTFVINLKPESSELLYNVDVTRLYESQAKQQSFFFAIWRTVIYSKIILQIDGRINKIGKVEYSGLELDIHTFIQNNATMLNSHFFESMNIIHSEINNSNEKSENILNNYYVHLINPMRELIKRFVQKDKYFNISILADNLDQSWDLQADLSVQVNMIFSLFEVTKEIQKDLKNRTDDKVQTQVIIFLRKDIFERMLTNSREPDKLLVNEYEIDWVQFPNLLKQIIEKRFRYVLELDENYEIDKIWQDYFSFGKRKDNFEVIRTNCLPRPRDILYFIGRLFESAYNNNRPQVTDKDLQYAIDKYNYFLYHNLIIEMGAKYPSVSEIFASVQTTYTKKFPYSEFLEILSNNGITETENEEFVGMLIANNYAKISDEDTGKLLLTHHEAILSIKSKYKKILFLKFKKKGNVFIEFVHHVGA